MAGIAIGAIAVLLILVGGFFIATRMGASNEEASTHHEQELADAVAATEHASENANNSNQTGSTATSGNADPPASSDSGSTASGVVVADSGTPAVSEAGAPSAGTTAAASATPEAVVPVVAAGVDSGGATLTTEAAEPTATSSIGAETETASSSTSTVEAQASGTAKPPVETLSASGSLAISQSGTPTASGSDKVTTEASPASLKPRFTLNVRSGPSTDFAVMDSLTTGEAVDILASAISGGDEWYQIEMPNGEAGWITGNESLVEVSGAANVKKMTAADLPKLPTAVPGLASVSSPSRSQTLSGNIYYSASSPAGRDGIYRVPATGGNSELVVSSARQPAVSPDGEWLAYKSLDNNSLGLSGYELTNGRTVRYASAPEDSLPNWDSGGTQVIYTSNREGDRDFRIYYGVASSQLGRGTDPNWMPNGNKIVFRGCDVSGSQCGLWTMSPNGSDRQKLTDVSSDSRPKWSQDGKSVVFMSSGRDGNWEIYSVDVATGTVTRLTNSPSNDGLPVFSPDGSHIAFVTNRSSSGAWEIRVMPSSGGDADLVTTISGNLSDRLSEGIDWTN